MGGCGAGHTENSGMTVGQIGQLTEHDKKMTKLNFKMLFRRIERLEERVRHIEEACCYDWRESSVRRRPGG